MRRIKNVTEGIGLIIVSVIFVDKHNLWESRRDQDIQGNSRSRIVYGSEHNRRVCIV